MKAYQNTTDTRVALLEQSIVNINETLKRLETKIDNNYIQSTSLSWSHFKRIIGIIVTLFSLPIIQNIITHFWSH